MFPTHVGMNRSRWSGHVSVYDVPHTRGDEPEWREAHPPGWKCSPHTWG